MCVRVRMRMRVSVCVCVCAVPVSVSVCLRDFVFVFVCVYVSLYLSIRAPRIVILLNRRLFGADGVNAAQARAECCLGSAPRRVPRIHRAKGETLQEGRGEGARSHSGALEAVEAVYYTRPSTWDV